MARPVAWNQINVVTCVCGRQFVVRKGQEFRVQMYTQPSVQHTFCVAHEVRDLPEPERWAIWMEAMAANA